MKLRQSSTLLMMASASVWALIPLFFALGAERGDNAFLFTAMFNALGGMICFGLYGVRVARTRDWRHLAAMRSFALTPRGQRTLALDGGAIAISNAAFVYALTFEMDGTVTLIVESWPLLATFLLTAVISRFQKLSRRQLLWSAIAVVGFYFLVVSRGENMWRSLSLVPLLAALVAAVFQAITVSAHQRALQDLTTDLDIEKNFLLQGTRMLVAAALSLPFALITGGGGLNAAAWTTGLGLAVAILTSALLYAMSLQVAASAVTTIIWFITPVISIFLLAIAGFADLTSNLMVGATLVISANIFLQERLESTVNIAALVGPTVGVGTLILYLPGLAVSNYFDYVQIVAAFYGILQGFLLSRLWDRRTRIGVLEEIWTLQGRAAELFAERVEIHDQGHESARDVAELNVLRQEVRSYSEAILLTILGVAAGGVIVLGRENVFIGNVLAFLIPVAIAYLLAISWSLIRSNSYRQLAIVSEAGIADAVMSYLLVVVIFAAMLVAIAINTG